MLVFGEAPGHDEDLQGRPFVGKSGQLLDRILEVCGFTREKHVYISNIIKCRPADNRIPTPAEAEVCMPWLLNQIELINPVKPALQVCEHPVAYPAYHLSFPCLIIYSRNSLRSKP